MIRGTLWEILLFSLPRVRFWPLLIPVAIASGVGFVVNTERIHPYVFQQQGEYAAIVILSLALVCSYLRLRKVGDLYFRWLTWLIAVLLLRELDPPGASIAAELALPVLALLAGAGYFRMSGYFANGTVLSLMVFVLFTYVVTEMLDGGAFKFLPREEVWERGTEEVTELVGHVGVVLLALWSREGTSPLLGSWPERLAKGKA